MLSNYHAKYYAHELSIRSASSGVDRLSQSLFDAKIDLNPHQIEAALFALKNPLNRGVLMADEVGLGKTIEAGLVLCQYWAERKRSLLIICPAALRKQWAEELLDKFNLPTQVIDSKTYKQQQQAGNESPLRNAVVSIMSYHYAAKMEEALVAESWDLVVIDEAHKLRNAHQKSNKMGQTLRRALKDRKKLLLTATPLQNSLMEIYGLSTLVDEHLFGDDKAFRQQYTGSQAKQQALKQRLKGFAQRTLRKDVLEYIKYTERKPLTIRFSTAALESQIYEAVSAFLLRKDSYALPTQQRHLTGLVLRKLLASSTPAILNTLKTIRKRLRALQTDDSDAPDAVSIGHVIGEEEMGSDYQEAASRQGQTDLDAGDNTHTDELIDQKLLAEELDELESIIRYAEQHLSDDGDDAKALALLEALQQGFATMQAMGAPQKAIIFTESKRTQDYLIDFLSRQGFKERLVAFSGTNNDANAKTIYADWKKANQGSAKITGSAQVDKRTALIDHFRESADIMIATEAAAEGVNLQFCSLLINYDLPWNPQRVEQRIGRCHRYGQKFDVVVINFVNESNAADQRVLELLTEKFQLFDGVFGSSDEILGKVEAGIDIEKRILRIFETCRSPEEIEAGFAQLQKDCEVAIKEKLQQTQEQLLEHFDEDIHALLKMQLDAAEKRLGKISRWFWGLSQQVLADSARFADDAFRFVLHDSPLSYVPEGQYQLIRQRDQKTLAIEAGNHLYRLSHPLGEWVIEQGKQADTPLAHLTFDYSGYGSKISLVEELRGRSGFLVCQQYSIAALRRLEEHLVFALQDDSGRVLSAEVAPKLFRLDATVQPTEIAWSDGLLVEPLEQARQSISRDVNDRNLQFFEQEMSKLDAWADDLKDALEQAIRDLDVEIRRVRREAKIAPTLDEKLALQKQQRALEKERTKQRRALYDEQDAVDERREAMIEKLEDQLGQDTEVKDLFRIRWSVA